MIGRPSKEGVDYFPHLVKHGETMFLLEKAFGNDGYAAWFKILETLGAKPDHFINCDGNSHHWDYLKAKTSLEDQKLTAIVDLLAKLGAIDQELWTKEKVIWSENFVSRLAGVYTKRKKEIPCKPTFCDGNYINKDFSEQKSPETPQSKVKERKVEKSKEVGSEDPPLEITKEDLTESAIPRINEELSKLTAKLYHENTFPDAPKFKNQMLKQGKNARAILHAFIRCDIKKPGPKEAWGYCLQIMKVEDGNYNERDQTKTA